MRKGVTARFSVDRLPYCYSELKNVVFMLDLNLRKTSKGHREGLFSHIYSLPFLKVGPSISGYKLKWRMEKRLLENSWKVWAKWSLFIIVIMQLLCLLTLKRPGEFFGDKLFSTTCIFILFIVCRKVFLWEYVHSFTI